METILEYKDEKFDLRLALSKQEYVIFYKGHILGGFEDRDKAVEEFHKLLDNRGVM